MKSLGFILCAATLGLAPIAEASPRSLDCQVAGDAGTRAFPFIYDEENRTASAVWAVPRPYLGRAGIDESISPTISVGEVSAGFNPMFPDPGGYIIQMNRTNGAVIFTLTPGGERISHSYGQCQRSTAPVSPF